MQQLQPQSRAVDVDVERYGSEIQVVFSQVYLLMTLGLVVTALVAAWVSTDRAALTFLFSNWWIPIGLFVVQIIIVITLSAAVMRLSPGVAVALFIAYSALTGVTLSTIFLVYTDASIATTFLITAGSFGAMSVFGFVTKRDLTKLGSLMIMLLLGFLLGTLLNLFLHSPAIYWVLTFVGIGIFVGLIAYDTQKIKKMAASGLTTGRSRTALAVIGALALYLDFINLFLLLLRIFGRQR
jgi:FtsH-binding integral membrane protein